MKIQCIIFYIIAGIIIVSNIVNAFLQYKAGNIPAVLAWCCSVINIFIAISCKIECNLIEKFKE